MLLFGCASEDAAIEPPSTPAAGDADQSPEHRTDLLDCLPDPAKLGTWAPAGAPDCYVGEDLFIYINGGAEIYHEYGFEQVLVQRFESPPDRTITLEIFRMSGSDAAFGIYSFKRGARGDARAFGDGGILESYYLNFWKDDLLVTLIGQDDSPATREGLELIAGAVDARIARSGNPPRLVELLPEAGLIEQRSRYLAGPLGLFNCCPDLPRNVFDFEDAAVGVYDQGWEVYLFRYADTRSCEEHYVKIREAFRTGEGFSSFEENGEGFSVRDEEDRILHIQPLQEYIKVVYFKD
jgi:hypothetical protein